MNSISDETPGSDEMPISQETIEEVRRLHVEVETLASDLVRQLGDRLVCRCGCSDCCIDDLTIFPVEAAVIRAGAAEILATARPHPSGRCAFLDDGGSCRIYPFRPYVCRTQGLPLRWMNEDPGGEVREMRDICPLNDEAIRSLGERLEDVPPETCWTLGEFEGRLAGLQASLEGFSDQLSRVSLRSLFDIAE